MFSGIGKRLLKKVVLASINEFCLMAFPNNDSCLEDSLFMCFFIFCSISCQFIIIASFKLSQNIIPNILISSFCSLTVMFGKFCCM